MTEIVVVPAAPVVPPFPALGSPNFNQEAYDNGSAMPGVTQRVHEMAVTAHTNATAAQERATAAAGSATTATTQADLATGYRNAAGSHAATATEKAALASAASDAAALSKDAAQGSASAAALDAQRAEDAAAGISDGPVTSVNGLTGIVKLALTDLQGATTIYVNQSIDYTITNYDSFSSYAVAVSAGSAGIVGATVTLVAPAVSGPVTLTVTKDGVARAIALTVLAAGVATPAITSPAAGATVITGPSITITASAFAWLGAADAHLDTDWELWTGPGRTGTLAASSLADAANKTSWATTVAVATTYYPVARYRGTANGVGAWSAASSFTTAANFNDYIATPTATPAIGSALEGGFYAGMIWGELVQSASSTVIGTGTKVLTVPSMTGAPIVYAGQALEVRSRANPANKMIGTVTGAIGTTLTLNIASVGGSGAFTDWSVMSRFRVIVAPKASGENASIAWKNANDAGPAATGTLTEGRKATLAMVAAGTSAVYPAAHWCNNLSIGGKTDWHLPARDELELCWRNLKPVTDANYTSRSTGATPNYANLGSYADVNAAANGENKNSDPTGAVYTSGAPAQTSAAAFKTGGAEAFAYGSEYYWSSTEFSASHAWSQYWNSSYPGYQSNTTKTDSCRVRAVRRSII